MKLLILGILTIGSFSVFADDCVNLTGEYISNENPQFKVKIEQNKCEKVSISAGNDSIQNFYFWYPSKATLRDLQENVYYQYELQSSSFIGDKKFSTLILELKESAVASQIIETFSLTDSNDLKVETNTNETKTYQIFKRVK